MTDSPRGSRQHRLLWWLVGIPVAAALLVGLAVLLTPAILFSSLASHADDRERAQAAQDRASAIAAQWRLHEAAEDGDLTDLEIAEAAGRLWSVQRTPQQIRVTTGYPAVDRPGACYVLVLPLPVEPGSKSSLEVGSPCPSGPAVPPSR